MLSSLFIWENFAMTSTVRRITSTTKLNNARMNVSNARVSSRFIRYIRVAAPCICFVPWAALVSCRPRPQQQLPVSATGGGRCRCSSPSRLRAGYFQKSFLPDLCLFYVEIEKPAIRDRKHDHQFCNQRLIVILTQSFGNYNKSRPAVIPGGGGRCTLLRAKQKIFTECRCTHRPAPYSCCARHRTCRTCCRCRCGRPPAGGHRG